jgi:hypothetical protein
MNLIKQFPDFSADIRAKLALSKNSNRKTQAKSVVMDTLAEAETKYYKKEFRKWHYKLAIIVGLIVTALYAFILNVPRLIHLVQLIIN